MKNWILQKTKKPLIADITNMFFNKQTGCCCAIVGISMTSKYVRSRLEKWKQKASAGAAAYMKKGKKSHFRAYCFLPQYISRQIEPATAAKVRPIDKSFMTVVEKELVTRPEH